MANEAFSYNLPTDVIAQRPVHPYHSAKMLAINRGSGEICDETFFDITKYLKAGDLLILNNSKVVPARLLGHIESGASVELLCVEKRTPLQIYCIAKPMRKLPVGRVINFSEGLKATVLERRSECEILVEFSSASGDTESLVRNVGIMPIPPYIRSGKSDADDFIDYQTFFAETEGSIAAPTASLHFTPELMDKIKALGVDVAFITLHVGTASFLPIETEDGELRKPGLERYMFSKRIIEKITQARSKGGRVITVGTTSVRALESMARECQNGIEIEEADGSLLSTEIFITPGYKFQNVDVLVTNFHQPRTTHLLLVEAFLGKKFLVNAYEHALSSNYRFLSYGDGMFIYGDTQV